MGEKSILVLLFMALLLAACASTTDSLPNAVTQNPINPLLTADVPQTYPNPNVGQPTTMPYPSQSTPTPTSAANPTPGENNVIPPSGYEVQPGDNHFRRDPVELDLVSSQLVITNTLPILVNVILNGNLPDPKHVLRVVVAPADAQNTINIEVYSLVPPGILSLTTVQPFSADIPLGSYTAGLYTVKVNGMELGRFMADYAPRPADAVLTRDNVTLDSAELVTTDKQPIKVSVLLSGYMSDPCHQLRIAPAPIFNQNEINLQVYSVYDPQTMCTMVIKSLEVSFPLDNFPRGHYSVSVNGQLLGEFDK